VPFSLTASGLWANLRQDMSKNMTISKDALENLARKIHESAYKGFYRNRITVFLGGAGLGKKGSARDQI